MLKTLQYLLTLSVIFECTSGLYFHIGETERKCFMEEIPDETTVLGNTFIPVPPHPPPKTTRIFYSLFFSHFQTVNYKVELYDPRSQGFMPSSPGIGMHVEVKDADDKVVLSRVYSSEGRISFTSHTPGEHVICLYSNSTAWFSGGQLVRIPFKLSSIS
jgi:hypothetical protein